MTERNPRCCQTHRRRDWASLAVPLSCRRDLGTSLRALELTGVVMLATLRQLSDASSLEMLSGLRPFVLAGGLLLVLPSSAAPKAVQGCAATSVAGGHVRADGSVAPSFVRAGPFRGYVSPSYDIVEGRFRLHVGPFRDKARGLSQKIPWFVNRSAGAVKSLTIVGTRLTPRPRRTFKQLFRSSSRTFFATTISPPFPGCWRLQLGSGAANGSLVAVVDP